MEAFQQKQKRNLSWQSNPHIRLVPPEHYFSTRKWNLGEKHTQKARLGQESQEDRADEKEKEKEKEPRIVYLYSSDLDWTNQDFEAHKQNYQLIQPFLSEKTKQRVETSTQAAQVLWARTLEKAHLLDFYDCMVHPQTRDVCFPKDTLATKTFLKDGYIPLAVGDGYRYSLLRIPGTEHCGIYLGLGFGGHFIVDRHASKKICQTKIGFVFVEDLKQMFSRGDFQFTRHTECNTHLDRAEIVRRVLSTATDAECRGCFRYSVANFNCQTAVMGWRDQPPPDTTWGEALLWTSFALVLLLLIFMLIWIFVWSNNGTTTTEVVRVYQLNPSAPSAPSSMPFTTYSSSPAIASAPPQLSSTTAE